MLPRPRVRIPLWAALAIPGAVYTVRALALRAGDFSPDLPGDAITGALLIAAVVLVGLARRAARDSGRSSGGHTEC